MRIALFSDVHANLPALKGVLQHIDLQKPDFVYCLGDLVGYNVWANEVVETIRRKNIPTLAGNYDEGVGLNSDDCGCAYKSDDDKNRGVQSIAYTNSIISAANRAYLRMLPKHISLKFKEGDNQFNLLMVHGSPRKINEYLFEDRPAKSLLRLMEENDTAIMLFGHTHKPYHRTLPYEVDGLRKFRHAINLGSVGKPKDGDCRACYVMLSIDEHHAINEMEGIKADFVRVAYDVEQAAKAVEESPLPNEFADMLRKAY